jgi:lipopolysaccharide transport system ATP-binding protein
MSKYAIKIENIGKKYKLFDKNIDKVFDAFGLSKMLFWRDRVYQEIWALQNINVEISKGERLGIIGSNGAGKSTLLQIITGNVFPTEGSFEINGKLQALMYIGSGFHPEFTGRENIRASLGMQGEHSDKIRELENDIIEFAELNAYIDQPVKTYSAGMYTRLAFSTATAIDPEILIVDEVLGAGDSYFASKCLERMIKLTKDSGAAVLFVSHDLQSVLRLCNKCIWLEHGKIIAEGSPMEVIKEYSKYSQALTERRLNKKNNKFIESRDAILKLDNKIDTFYIWFMANQQSLPGFQLNEISIWEDDKVVDTFDIGREVDKHTSGKCTAVVDAESNWIEPTYDHEGNLGRGLRNSTTGPTKGLITLFLNAYRKDAKYKIKIVGLGPTDGSLDITMFDGNKHHKIATIESENIKKSFAVNSELPSLENIGVPILSRWVGNRQLIIEKISLQGADGNDHSVFTSGMPMRILILGRALIRGVFSVIFNVVIYRMDGVRVSCHISEAYIIEANGGDGIVAELNLGNLNLGNGHYTISAALYKKLDGQLLDNPEVYDLLDRSYEFKVDGCLPVDQSIFHHSNRWVIQDTK